MLRARGGREPAVECREGDRKIRRDDFQRGRKVERVHPAQQIAACELAGTRCESKIYVQRLHG